MAGWGKLVKPAPGGGPATGASGAWGTPVPSGAGGSWGAPYPDPGYLARQNRLINSMQAKARGEWTPWKAAELGYASGISGEPETSAPAAGFVKGLMSLFRPPTSILQTMEAPSLPALRMAEGIGRQAYSDIMPVARLGSEYTPGGGFGADVTEAEKRAAAYGAGNLLGMISTLGVPEAADMLGDARAWAIRPFARAAAPGIEESGLGITDLTRGRVAGPLAERVHPQGMIGREMLDQSTGYGVRAQALSGIDRSLELKARMEENLREAGRSGITGSNAAAHEALSAAAANVERNAPEIAEKIEGLRPKLDLPGHEPGTPYTPSELLEIKRGIGKSVGKWTPEWQRDGDVLRARNSIYGAIDNELDRIVPGNKEINDSIHRLIAANEAATRRAYGAGGMQSLADRIALRTGGSQVGLYELMSGDPVRAAATVALQEAAGRPWLRTALARTLWKLGGLGGEPVPPLFDAPTPGPTSRMLGPMPITPAQPMQPMDETPSAYPDTSHYYSSTPMRLGRLLPEEAGGPYPRQEDQVKIDPELLRGMGISDEPEPEAPKRSWTAKARARK